MQRRKDLVQLSIVWTQALANLPLEVIPCFLGPKQSELAEIQQEFNTNFFEDTFNQQESGYDEFKEDDLDMGLVEYTVAQSIVHMLATFEEISIF